MTVQISTDLNSDWLVKIGKPMFRIFWELLLFFQELIFQSCQLVILMFSDMSNTAAYGSGDSDIAMWHLYSMENSFWVLNSLWLNICRLGSFSDKLRVLPIVSSFRESLGLSTVSGQSPWLSRAHLMICESQKKHAVGSSHFWNGMLYDQRSVQTDWHAPSNFIGTGPDPRSFFLIVWVGAAWEWCPFNSMSDIIKTYNLVKPASLYWMTWKRIKINFSQMAVCDLATAAIRDAVQCGLNSEKLCMPEMSAFSYFLRLPNLRN